MKKSILSLAAIILCAGALTGCGWHPPCSGGGGGGSGGGGGGSTELSPTQQPSVTNNLLA